MRSRRVLAMRLRREMGRALLDLVLPPHCLGCGDWAEALAGPALCAVCRRRLVRASPVGCVRCGAPTLGDRPCRADHRWLRGLRFARAPFAYRGTAGALVRRLKFRGEYGAASLLAGAMVSSLGQALPPGFHRAVLVPVPLHATRRKARGFDQAGLLAREVAGRTGLEVVRGLVRQRVTLPQGDPRVLSRERNIEGAFALRTEGLLEGRRVVLVDDVTTSGATARACARLLRTAGVDAVGLLTACRA